MVKGMGVNHTSLIQPMQHSYYVVFFLATVCSGVSHPTLILQGLLTGFHKPSSLWIELRESVSLVVCIIRISVYLFKTIILRRGPKPSPDCHRGL